MKIGPAEVELTGDRRHPDRRLAVPLPPRADDPRPEPARDGDRGGALARDPLRVRPGAARRPNGQMFFLGAGFMLLETKGVVHMALLFGSTWMVNSIVFFAILAMILLSNLYVLAVRPRRLWPYYALLLACALASTALVPMDDSSLCRARARSSLVPGGLPAGLLRGRDLRGGVSSSAQPDVDFGSNIAGIILGGLSENLSLVVGFNHLLGSRSVTTCSRRC